LVVQETGSEGKAFQSEQPIAGRGEFSLQGKMPARMLGKRIASIPDRSFKFGAASRAEPSGKSLRIISEFISLTGSRNFYSFGKCAQNTVNPWGCSAASSRTRSHAAYSLIQKRPAQAVTGKDL
jgi:hypothetical protein